MLEAVEEADLTEELSDAPPLKPESLYGDSSHNNLLDDSESARGDSQKHRLSAMANELKGDIGDWDTIKNAKRSSLPGLTKLDPAITSSSTALALALSAQQNDGRPNLTKKEASITARLVSEQYKEIKSSRLENSAAMTLEEQLLNEEREECDFCEWLDQKMHPSTHVKGDSVCQRNSCSIQ